MRVRLGFALCVVTALVAACSSSPSGRNSSATDSAAGSSAPGARSSASGVAPATTTSSASAPSATSGASDVPLGGAWVSEGWRTPSVIGHAHGGSGMRLEFGPHGDLFASFQHMVPVRISNYGVTSVFRYSGISDGTWTAHGNSLRLDYAEPHALGFHFTTQGYHLDQDFAHASSRTGVAGPFTAVDYFVNGSRMKTEMTIPHGNGAIVIMFHRVARS